MPLINALNGNNLLSLTRPSEPVKRRDFLGFNPTEALNRLDSGGGGRNLICRFGSERLRVMVQSESESSWSDHMTRNGQKATEEEGRGHCESQVFVLFSSL